MAEQEYVTNDAWLRSVGRPDLVDDIADQFERPMELGPESFWAADAGARWPRSSKGWRSMERLHPRAAERRVG
jgi:hypothetical protein